MVYFSVEYMGVLVLGFGFGGLLGIVGVMYYMFNYLLVKLLLFFGVGNVV